MVSLPTGWPAPSSSTTSSGAPAAELTNPDWPSPDTIVSVGGTMLAFKVTLAEASSWRTANTWIGAGPGPVLVTVLVAMPNASVTLVGDARVAPPLALQLMV